MERTPGDRDAPPPDIPAFPEAHQPWRLTSPEILARRPSVWSRWLQRRWFRVACGVSALLIVAMIGDTIAIAIWRLVRPADAGLSIRIDALRRLLFIRLLLEHVPAGFGLGWAMRRDRPFRYLTAVGFWFWIAEFIVLCVVPASNPGAWLGAWVFILPFLYLGGAIAVVVDETCSSRRRRRRSVDFP